MKKLNFSNPQILDVFASREITRDEFAKLMFDTANNTLEDGITPKEANEQIRNICFDILGVDKNCSRKDLRRAIRRHKIDIFELIEEVVPNLLVSGWGENPFFNEFVEQRNLALGDMNEFYVEDDTILSVSDLSGGHHDIIRQQLGAGETFSVKTSWYGVKIYAEYELFMAGRIDWAKMIMKIYEAFDQKVNSMVFAALASAGTKIPNQSQFNKTGALSASTKDTFNTLVEDVQAATGEEVIIMGTKSALSKLFAIADADWISESMKEERHTLGRIAICEGTRTIEIPQRFAPNDTTKKLVPNDTLWIFSVGDNKFIKIVDEGEAVMAENTDGNNMDKTIEAEYQQKMGVGVVINKIFGVWKITA